MSNLPAVHKFTVPSFTREERSPLLKANLGAYTSLIVYSVCLLMVGVVTGLEQGRKPMIKAITDQAAANVAQVKVEAIKAVFVKFKAPASFQDFRMEEKDDKLEIHFGTSGLFERGQANLSPATEGAVMDLALALYPVAKNAPIQIEAFTDDAPMADGSWHYPTNWELSGARAARFLRVFNKAGFANLTFVGFGERNALYPNRGAKGEAIEANRLRNRRVVIRISPL